MSTLRGKRGFPRTIGHQYRIPESIRPFVGPAGFPDFGCWGWTGQADRLPWRPYGLIRANIISEDARKNRRISENSFGRLAGFLFFPPSFLLPLFPSRRWVASSSSSSRHSTAWLAASGQSWKEKLGVRFAMCAHRSLAPSMQLIAVLHK